MVFVIDLQVHKLLQFRKWYPAVKTWPLPMKRCRKDVAEVAEMLYHFEKPLVVSHHKFERAFGATPAPHREALRETLERYRTHPLAEL